MSQIRRVIRALEILATYDEYANIMTEHDGIYIGTCRLWEQISSTDQAELLELGVRLANDSTCYIPA